MGNHLSDMALCFRRVHVVLVGLDCSGKTSLLYQLKLKEFVQTVQTKSFNTERVRLSVGGASSSRRVDFQLWDVGGREKLRPLWRSYTRRTDGLLFVVDASEPERMDEARVELRRITGSAHNHGVPVLVLANKQDAPAALGVAQVEKLLGVHELSAHTPRHVHGCSAVDGRGLQTGLETLHHMILKRRKMMKTKR
ncbi:ADP-ribosylation factor-like protein 4D [Gouania willdenowi]|uniref:ADP-ribosylation factor-like protein 4D n=1 Tax=Gouania willdenowi TaxID=441366 RepID=UPI001054F0C3|nr:ADP-ribosylation factor-like protein 4D [Gouania willdenowi]